jgi:DNA helicase-2/ATP-dependent DNA helicase PcrA
MPSFPLNPAQLAATEHMNGPLLVLAGAGSGKTRVITQRIARLVERGVPAKAIVALTFTNKAAGEMAERIGRAVHGGAAVAKQLTICTFHSFGLQVLTRERAATGGIFTIFDQGDCLAAVKDILSRIDAGRRFDAAAILARISNAKNAFLSPEAYAGREADAYDEITKLVYPRYEAALRNFKAYDFDDLVCGVARLWTERADVLEGWRARYRYILVDEYQDTNRAQLQLLRLLAEPHRNICVVGDDDQAIYAWRGADVRNILEFEEHFPGAKVVKLEQNYRSCKPVLDVANAVIAKRPEGTQRHRKVLFTARAGGEKVRVGIAATPEAEAAHVAREIARMIRDEGRRPRDFAVLYRSNGQAPLVEAALRENGVAHKVVGGQQFFERKEVKDLLAYLKLALNPADEISLRRVLNYPARGIGETSIERLGQHALAKGWTLWQTVERVDAIDDITGSAREGCKALERALGELRSALVVARQPASVAARAFAESVGIKRDIEATSPSPNAAARRWGNVEALLRTFAKREQRETQKGNDATHERALAAFLHALTLSFDDEETAHDRVTLSTLHGSKGLEFDVVFFLGCEEGLMPHARTLDARATDAPVIAADGAVHAASDVEEERRLFYVGVTRAKDRLTILRCKVRVLRGKPVPRTPSRFLLDIPEELVESFEVSDPNALSPEAMNESANALLAALDALG